ncbi:MAG: aryl-sulfate sulfotransferase [Bacteroidetes bacterium]|nr:aryl-sulfate sulfotransferase [Bacteroidota bacterium]
MNRIHLKVFILIFMMSAFTLNAQTYGDYTFYAPKTNGKAYLVDMSGNTYHTWTFAANAPTGYSSYLLQGGTVLRTVAKTGNSFTGGPVCGEVQKVDWNGNVVWDFVYSTTTYCSHHDICPMPNGNVLLIAYESKTPAEVTQAGCSQSITMWPERIVEIQPSGTTGGTVVWEWHAWDHLCQNYNAAKSNYVTSIVQHPELLNINYNTQKDWMHANGIDYNAALDQITFSSHYLNELYVIDHSTTTAQAAGHTGGNSGKGGDLLYRWGNPAAYQASGTTIFNVVHDAHWVPADCPNANYLAGFNNKGGTGNKTCVDLINPPYNGYNYNLTPGSAYAPATYDWRHTYSGTPTQDEGNSQQLPNGNTLVCISFSGYIYEINPGQTVVWSKTIAGSVTNAFRYTACYVNGPGTVTATASPNQVCTGTSVQLTATPSGGTSNTYSWTSLPAGFTSTLQNPVVSPAVTTSYIVTMTSGTCSAGDTVTVTVIPQPTVAASAYPSQVCPFASAQLSAVPSGTGPYSYSWTSVPAGFTSALQNPVVNPGVATTYTVTITSGTCTATNSTTVDMLAPPTVLATADPQEICPNGSSQLNATPGGTANYVYAWTSIPAGFTSALPNPAVSPSATTMYIAGILADGCQASDSVLVTVDALPATPVITLSGDSLMSSSPAGNQWYLDGGILSGATGQYLLIPQPGSYQVQVTGSTGCISQMSAPFIYVGIGEAIDGCSVTVYPNPTNGTIRVGGTGLENRSFDARLFNSLGRMVLSSKNICTFDLSGMAGGIYYLSIVTDRSESLTKKIILIK